MKLLSNSNVFQTIIGWMLNCVSKVWLLFTSQIKLYFRAYISIYMFSHIHVTEINNIELI